MSRYKQGIFRPNHPEKYRGNIKKNPPVYRSSWEMKLMLKLDNHPDVIEWSSEEVVIPYKSPIDNKYHRYFVDFYVKLKDVNGNVVEKIIEVKPKHQVQEPIMKKNKRKNTFLKEVMTWGVNQAKWEAARKVADNKGWSFEIFTEDDLNVLFKEYITEVFNKPAVFRDSTIAADTRKYDFSIGKNQYGVDIKSIPNRMYTRHYIAFYHVSEEDSFNTDMTGFKESHRVLSTVVNVVRHHFKKYPLKIDDVIMFSGENEGGREKVYDRLAKMIMSESGNKIIMDKKTKSAWEIEYKLRVIK